MKRDIEKEIELETKDYKHLMETLLSKINNNIENGNSDELKCACEMLEKVADAKLDCIKGVYHIVLMDAMLNSENQYGEDWDENGPMKKGYMPKMTTNMNDRMYRGYDSMMMPEIDRPINNNMYRTDSSMNNSRYDRARRGYEEIKDMNSLNRIFDIIEEDMKELKPTMSSQDKQTAHQRLSTLSSMMNV